MCGSKTEEMAGEWGRLHSEELCDLYPSPNIFRVIKSRRMTWAGHVPRIGEKNRGFREGNRKVGRRRHRSGDNIEMDLQEIERGTGMRLI
jgi:hypothetical protein